MFKNKIDSVLLTENFKFILFRFFRHFITKILICMKKRNFRRCPLV